MKLDLHDWPERTETWQDRLASRTRLELSIPDFRHAAVLVPLTLEPEPRVLLTVRSDHLPSHKGQISFPGGKLNDQETVILAALREAHEEVGLEPSLVRALGVLDDVWTPQGFQVTPVLAGIPANPTLHLNTGEVAEAILVPLRDLMRLEPRREIRQPTPGMRFPAFALQDSRLREVLHFDWNGYDIWGMTARIIFVLLEMLRED